MPSKRDTPRNPRRPRPERPPAKSLKSGKHPLDPLVLIRGRERDSKPHALPRPPPRPPAHVPPLGSPPAASEGSHSARRPSAPLRRWAGPWRTAAPRTSRANPRIPRAALDRSTGCGSERNIHALSGRKFGEIRPNTQRIYGPSDPPPKAFNLRVPPEVQPLNQLKRSQKTFTCGSDPIACTRP